MTSTANNTVIKRHVAIRAREFGDMPMVEDIEIVWSDMNLHDEIRMFTASWLGRSGQRALAGISTDKKIESRSLEAMKLILQKWKSQISKFPSASIAAQAFAYILDPEQKFTLFTCNQHSRPDSVSESTWSQIQNPVYDDVDKPLPLVFWWMDKRAKIFRVEISQSAEGELFYNSERLILE